MRLSQKMRTADADVGIQVTHAISRSFSSLDEKKLFRKEK